MSKKIRIEAGYNHMHACYTVEIIYYSETSQFVAYPVSRFKDPLHALLYFAAEELDDVQIKDCHLVVENEVWTPDELALEGIETFKEISTMSYIQYI